MLSPAERRRRRLWAAAGLVLLAVPGVALAEATQSDLVLIREDDVVAEDLYAAGNTVQIDGRVEGDVVASSLGDLRISGSVEGDVLAIASRVVISGVVDGSVRVISPEVVVEGRIGDDLVVVARRFSALAESDVDRDVLGVAWGGSVQGKVGRNLEGVFRSLVVAGQVDNNVEVDVRSLEVTADAVVSRNLVYRSSSDAAVDDRADVEGTLIRRAPLPPNVRLRGLWVMGRLLAVIFGAGVGLSIVWAAPARSLRAASAAVNRPFAAFGNGLMVLGAPLLLIVGIAVVATFMTPESALPLLLATVPFVLAVIGAVAVWSLASVVAPAVAIGARLAASRSPHGRFLTGFLVLAVLSFVPVLGALTIAAVLIGGTGAWLVRADEHGGPTDGGRIES
ncbi:MAG: polymer-forming cytoskeletal protein [Acidimicrobiia bacterium]|nr:polymer-forming cytoskeletal protein [Acidimicrobiia bacterium]MDH5292530.1 polymer-forming cytoskeletal protein [Acidimicrobiia bacterium]